MRAKVKFMPIQRRDMQLQMLMSLVGIAESPGSGHGTAAAMADIICDEGYFQQTLSCIELEQHMLENTEDKYWHRDSQPYDEYLLAADERSNGDDTPYKAVGATGLGWKPLVLPENHPDDLKSCITSCLPLCPRNGSIFAALPKMLKSAQVRSLGIIRENWDPFSFKTRDSVRRLHSRTRMPASASASILGNNASWKSSSVFLVIWWIAYFLARSKFDISFSGCWKGLVPMPSFADRVVEWIGSIYIAAYKPFNEERPGDRKHVNFVGDVFHVKKDKPGGSFKTASALDTQMSPWQAFYHFRLYQKVVAVLGNV